MKAASEVWEDRKIKKNGEVHYVTVPKLFLQTLAQAWDMSFEDACRARVIWEIGEDGKPRVEIVRR